MSFVTIATVTLNSFPFLSYLVSFIFNLVLKVLCCLKCKVEGEHNNHSTTSLTESQELLKETLKDCIADIGE